MSLAQIIDGKAIAKKLRLEIAAEVAQLQEQYKVTPGLAVILVGDHPASHLYVRNKIKACKEVGISLREYYLPATISEENLIKKISLLNKDDDIHGILIQLPLPASINSINIINAINPSKDVDGFGALNLGKLVTEQDCFIPCTPQGCLILIKSILPDITGLNALIIGRSNIVGKPMLHALLQEHCTVTLAHSYSKNLANLCGQADIIVAAVGKPEFIKGSWIKPGSIILDVGINYDQNDCIIGDVEFNQALKYAKAISPVPGGVGPMTVTCLLKNTLKSAINHHKFMQ